ncbi:DEAD/DEAH box helicase [Magnetospirillum aberrantis]|uniref:DEAD-box ATP-dependent RNA helicase RhpA n=1 Tax=Magnetospirillum aberrantis SpK TaxID=908842 RepID=A0A7C9UY83_9PROT|nr:DEAD/DEAH box helicase [Magnetospirillum aberrantis]NFV79631.1 DEAD/DEAH box helicase [Magnetospirillum aberrantis SpK]
MTTFSELGLAEPLIRALDAEGYTTPTPIQAQAIPHLLEGRDVLGIAQTGTGKTAAFALPILHRLNADRRRPAARTTRVLILTPTRELAVQIGEGFAAYGKNVRFKRAVIFGGVGQVPQVQAVAPGIEVLVATPGRLIDLMDQGHLTLTGVEMLVLDEADRMLDMGFIHAVRKIAAKLPKKRQTLLFSATMPDSVAELAAGLLHDPVRVEVTPVATTAEKIDQKVLFVTRDNKRALLVDLLRDKAVGRAIIFTRTKHGANRVAEALSKSGVAADAIHGNKSQGARQKALNAFKTGDIRALVATDIAARGIDVDGITHVINFELPNEPESYVHRIGRTARAGADGIALSLCDAEEVAYLRQIEKTIRMPVPVEVEHEWHAEGIHKIHVSKGPAPKPPAQGQRGRGGSRPQEGRPAVGKPAGSKLAGGKPAGGKPSGSKGQGAKPAHRDGQGQHGHGQRGARAR